jgi:hypothetical protein
MPTRLRYLLDRLPLPSLRTYTLISIVILLANVIYFHQLIQSDMNETSVQNESNTSNSSIQNHSIRIDHVELFSLAYAQTLLLTVISQSSSLLVK